MAEDPSIDRDGSDHNRRTFLQAVGSSTVAAAGLSGTVSAESDGNEASSEQSDDDESNGETPNNTQTIPLTHGVASGDVTATTAVVWARTADTATLQVQYSTDDEFDSTQRQTTTVADSTDYTGHVRLTELQPATRYYYRVWATAGTSDESNEAVTSDGDTASVPDSTVEGTFVTPPKATDDGAVTFAWSGDTWGYGPIPVDPPFEGLQTIAERQPDFFLYHGDTIYADAKTPAGRVTSDTSLADALDIYRGKYKEMRVPPESVAEQTYLRSLLAATSVVSIWDDHEVQNNFAGSIEPLMPSGRQAFIEYWPIDQSQQVTGTEASRLYRSFRWGAHLELFVLDTRQYRDPNLELKQKTLLGREQLEWLKSSLSASDATWKVIASPAPLGQPSDTWATPTERTGYEAELVELISYINTEEIANVVSVAGDVHYSQVSGFDPNDDGEFEFYEAVAGPLGAYPSTPEELYSPLNPTAFFSKGGYFNFGTVSVDESGDTLTIGIYDESGDEQFTKTIKATPASDGDVPERIESTFDDDAEGWLIAQNGSSNTPEYYSEDGNPSGHIGDSEDKGGVTWYYQAPFKFLGPRDAFYGGTLAFDLRQEETDQQFDAALPVGGDIVLSGSGMTLVYEFRGDNSKPETDWTSFEVSLSADDDWINIDSQDPFATEDEFRAVLSDLTQFRIRGEYRTGLDQSRLDNVVLTRE
ncbi:alkaline phosphatase D family protein [Halogeometricum borinquense]|uniref:Phosphodiesterase/alkaline phosphatase D n=1 Tax=Halogeometricum borinquense (strain ATCC 700274 / DSM 11551 / JCM 10706 / KCTC 4070 / PR3) TaxID=469382 RepID=E4NVR3_HALBP|nr:alkaline phosphatase D family protein [Halogeometricum borinquense]ADQ69133.1 phosphodiesterase/alkaline phosphatase D [Halogeometricum borinquense DSM 11551]